MATCKETCEVELNGINQRTIYLWKVSLHLNGYAHSKDICPYYGHQSDGKLVLIRCISWETGNHELLNVYYNDLFSKII